MATTRHAVSKLGQQMTTGAGQVRSPRVRLQIKHTQNVSALPTPRPTPTHLSQHHQPPQIPSAPPHPRSPPQEQETPEIVIPRVFDIFDAPVHLRRERQASSSSSRSASSRSPTPDSSFSFPVNTDDAQDRSRRHLHQPQPIVFDGPSRPWPLPANSMRDSREAREQQQQQHSRPRSSMQEESRSEVFDGPARLRRPNANNRGSSSPNSKKAALVAGTLALGAAAGAAAVLSAQP